jgi:hypothetical protein
MINTEEFKEDINQNVETSIEDIDIEMKIYYNQQKKMFYAKNEEIDKRKRILQNKEIIKDLDKMIMKR